MTTLIMLLVTLGSPSSVMKCLDRPRFAFLFTFRGRYVVDLIVSLFLFAMGIFGVILASVTLGLIFGIRFVGVQNPDAFALLFRQPAEVDDEGTIYTQDDTATYDDTTYDGGTYDGSTLDGTR
eukprot:CAMPEP_0184863064 /NCGR_PEP_ID=MMETSP0580-20130426/8866_1 /TAXON_ID=1118495 /ORGANISM="Dactyliosolen fragilissimus" /LENGTH=122 /DNA_ID=CAMNT_0027361131 /DNA_START=343 /DNA_END=711 /DNA_ORIENTATION=-